MDCEEAGQVTRGQSVLESVGYFKTYGLLELELIEKPRTVTAETDMIRFPFRQNTLANCGEYQDFKSSSR